MLALDPLAVLSAGFWLSFLAVSVIVYTIAGRLGKTGYFLEVIKINWATSVGLSPLLLFFFQQISLISPLANFIAVPVISLLVVPLSLLAVLVMFGSPLLANKLFMIVDTTLQGLWWLLARFGGTAFSNNKPRTALSLGINVRHTRYFTATFARGYSLTMAKPGNVFTVGFFCIPKT